jgi:hypothetical protein
MSKNDSVADAVVFLDFDGVLNCHEYLQCLNNVAYDDNDELMIDPERVALVNDILRRTHANVVISSSWRLCHSFEKLCRILTARGFKGEVIGTTSSDLNDLPIPPFETRQRGHEIQAWLDDHPDVKRFVIIDDDADMAHLMKHLVKTTFASGLQPEHVELAVEHLRP